MGLVAVLAMLGASTQVVAAQPDGRRPTTFTRLALGGHGDRALHFTPASRSNRLVNVMLQMRDQPVALRRAAALARGETLSKRTEEATRLQLKGKQDKIRPHIDRAGGRVVAQLQWAYDGVQVQAREKDVATLAALPGVAAVHTLRSFKPANVHGVPYIGGPEAWEDTGQAGRGVKIGVIDTGVDYTHADFGGPGTTAAFEAASKTSSAPADPDLFGPAAPKVKGGYDFVGDDYDAGTAGSVPEPDPNPLDCNGHGTHTAGTAAGFGVLDDGTTYHGAYKANTLSGHDWNVGPGVAPQADLYAYRVFGCAGTSLVVAAAIDRAAADGVDVINMSLGSPLGGVDDPTTVAAENAAKAGIAVVASAGNEGNNAYLVGSPSTGNHVLSVAALDASQPTYPGARLTFSKGGTVDTIDANGADLPTGPLPVAVLKNADGSISLGCDPAEYAGTSGDLVVTMRGTCDRVARAVYGQQAGAKAVVMLNNDDTLPPFEGPIRWSPGTGEPVTVTIPFLGAAGTAANTSTLLAADGGTVTLAAETLPNTGYQHAADFTSGGPRSPDSAPKPDVVAPGVSVASAGIGTGNGAAVISGTSMAAPMTAGTAALVKGAHPRWQGGRIKAAIQNTADPTLNQGYDVRLAGTGVVQAQKAVASTVLARTGNGLNSLAFGFVPGSGSYRATKVLTLTNTGSRPAAYHLGVDPNGDQHGASVTVSPGSVTVPPGATRNVSATISMSRTAFASLTSDDTFAIGPGSVLDVAGAVVATPSGSVPGQVGLRMAYTMVPRGLSDVRAGAPTTFRPTSGGGVLSARLPLANTGIHAGTADVYAWGISDPPDTGRSSMDVRAAGVQALPGEVLGADAADRSLVFAVSNWGSAANQSTNEFDIAVDNDGDGDPDVYVVGVDIGALTTGEFDGRLGSFTIDADSGEVLDGFVADAPMNGSVVELPAIASELGVTAGSSSFGYSVAGFSLLDTTLVDPTAGSSFDAFRPAVSSGQFTELAPGASTTVPLDVRRRALHGNKSALGWLVVSVDDPNGAPQADKVAAPRG
jgi:minor extracellular serine protease Vpr